MFEGKSLFVVQGASPYQKGNKKPQSSVKIHRSFIKKFLKVLLSCYVLFKNENCRLSSNTMSWKRKLIGTYFNTFLRSGFRES